MESREIEKSNFEEFEKVIQKSPIEIESNTIDIVDLNLIK